MKFTADQLVPDLHVLLYGPPGTGKTTGALSAPDPILLLNVEGQSASRWPKMHHAGSTIQEIEWDGLDTLKEAFLYARDPANGIKTIVIDSVAELHQRILLELQRSGGADRISLPMYGEANQKIEGFVRAVRTHVGLNLVLICHEQLDVTDEGPIRMPLTGGKQLPTRLCQMVDVVGYTTRIGDEFLAQYVSTAGRYGKDRTGLLGDAGPIDIGAWIMTLAIELEQHNKQQEAPA